MTPRARVIVFGIGGVAAAALLLWGAAGLSPFGRYPGPYGDVVNARAIPERVGTDVTTTVVFDYRGFDTLGEELILFACATGVAMMLRALREEQERDEGGSPAPVSNAIRITSLALVPTTFVLGVYEVAHGHVSPGGGFQGGVVIAAAFAFLVIAGRYSLLHALVPVERLEPWESAGVAGYLFLGLATLAAGSAFLVNSLPLGIMRQVFSAGTIPVLNGFVGIAVAAGVLLIFAELLHQLIEVHER